MRIDQVEIARALHPSQGTHGACKKQHGCDGHSDFGDARKSRMNDFDACRVSAFGRPRPSRPLTEFRRAKGKIWNRRHNPCIDGPAFDEMAQPILNKDPVVWLGCTGK